MAPRPDTAALMICRYCHTQRPVASFEVCRTVGGKAYRRRKCKHCKRKDQNQRRAQLRVWMEGYKKTLKCCRCGFADFRALEFHHHDDNEKDFNIGDMVRLGLSAERIQQEIDKCTILCANCHRIEHYVHTGVQ